MKDSSHRGNNWIKDEKYLSTLHSDIAMVGSGQLIYQQPLHGEGL